MIFTLFALAVAAAFFVSSLILLNYGRQLGLRYRQQQGGAESMAGLPSVEGAVFALIGLLIAFTISGALHRFDERRQLVIQEATAASTAYDRLDLFEGAVAKDAQKKLKQYVLARIDLYRMPHDFSGAVFDAARLRAGAADKHPPQILYVMLFGLGLGGSLLAGFGMAAAKARSWIHMVIFAATLSATLYVITDMEFPRLGLIRIEGFDQFLVEAYEQMRPRE